MGHACLFNSTSIANAFRSSAIKIVYFPTCMDHNLFRTFRDSSPIALPLYDVVALIASRNHAARSLGCLHRPHLISPLTDKFYRGTVEARIDHRDLTKLTLKA